MAGKIPLVFQKNIIIKHFEGRMLAEVQIRCYIRRLWVPLPRRASKEGCQWQRLCSAELSVKPCWTSRAGCQEWVGKQYLLGTSTQSPPGPQPCPWATQIRGQLAGSSSVKNRIGSLTSDSGCRGQPSRPLDTWPQNPQQLSLELSPIAKDFLSFSLKS